MLDLNELTVDDVERYLSKIDRSGGPDACWLWTKGTYWDGYGEFYFGGRAKKYHARSHRMAYFLFRDEDPGELLVMHLCDVRYLNGDMTYRKCCNPSHLSLGTIAENQADMVSKNRQSKGKAHGSIISDAMLKRAFCNTKLTKDQVREIICTPRCRGGDSMLAKRFGVSRELVRNVRLGKAYKRCRELL